MERPGRVVLAHKCQLQSETGSALRPSLLPFCLAAIWSVAVGKQEPGCKGSKYKYDWNVGIRKLLCFSCLAIHRTLLEGLRSEYCVSNVGVCGTQASKVSSSAREIASKKPKRNTVAAMAVGFSAGRVEPSSPSLIQIKRTAQQSAHNDS